MAVADQLSLFEVNPGLPDGFRYRPGLLDEGEERALVAAIERLPFKALEFHGFSGKRRVVSFGWRYDFNEAKLRESDPRPKNLPSRPGEGRPLRRPRRARLRTASGDGIRARRRERLAQGPGDLRGAARNDHEHSMGRAAPLVIDVPQFPASVDGVSSSLRDDRDWEERNDKQSKRGLWRVADWWPERRCPRFARSSMTRPARRGRDSSDPGGRNRQSASGRSACSLLPPGPYFLSASRTFCDALPLTGMPFFPWKSAIASLVFFPIAPSGAPTS